MKRLKVLLVDDEEEFVTTLSERLALRGLDNEVVYSGEAALSYIADHPPDVVVLDIRMPGIDGIETLRRIRTQHPAVKVIMHTGHGGEEERQEAFVLGASDYLHKPVSPSKLLKAVSKLL